MTVKELTKLKKLEQKVNLLQSFFISIVGADSEGRYRPGFVREVKKAMSETPTHSFRSPQSFLSELKAV